MTAEIPVVELSTVLAELGGTVEVHPSADTESAPALSGAAVWVPGDDVPADPSVAVVCTGLRSEVDVLEPVLSSSPARVVLVSDPGLDVDALASLSVGQHVVVLTSASAGEVISVIARLTRTMDESVSRRLASLQRTLSQALAEAAPVPALLARLKRLTNATSAVMDRHGAVLHSTGPVPRALLFERISATEADTQSLGIDGWRGIATRIADPALGDQHSGWLVLTSRRADFPDTYATSAAHVAASLIEASQRMTVVARQQERAIRAAVLEQALALRHGRGDNELAARVAGLGITFETEVRVSVAVLSRSPRADQRQQARDSLLDNLFQLLAAAGHPALLTARGNGVTMLVQCSAPALERMLATHRDELPALNVGIGRPLSAAEGVEGVADSFHDAQLAARTIRRGAVDQRLMAYEDFDFATRLFADVGLDRMVEWAEDFLRPLADRESLMAGLRAYFESDQNINVAAESLSIHHNSLRYRLAKVEELLTINLKQPSAVSSVFLALTAIELTRRPGTLRPQAKGRGGDVRDVAASAGGTMMDTDAISDLGVVISPDH